MMGMGKKWGWAVALLVCWGLVGGIIQMHRTGCFAPLDEACNSGLLTFVGNAIVLDWVYSYQSLITGVLTVFGASLVIIATRMQLEANRRDRIEERRERWYIAVSQLHSILAKAHDAFGGDEQLASLVTPSYLAMMGEFARYSGALAGRFEMAARAIDAGLRADHELLSALDFDPDGRDAPRKFMGSSVRDLGGAFGELAPKLASSLWRAMDSDGKVTMPSLPKADLLQAAKNWDVDSADLHWLEPYFDR